MSALRALSAPRQSQDRGLGFFSLKFSDELAPICICLEENCSWHEDREENFDFAVTAGLQKFDFDVASACFCEARLDVGKLAQFAPPIPFSVWGHEAPKSHFPSTVTVRYRTDFARRSAIQPRTHSAPLNPRSQFDSEHSASAQATRGMG